ncbi:hypothetical protein [Pseudogulbenkiania sp. MAI-1]|uniref:hypothetical protein n=1 Tax=Pseudogulbenkiania sp. MAI-1 TaxID=990370 RepID=UPI00045E7CAB|nr:hypothetical protein [Pseudogulbenkiania sp. MAI-1]
MRWDFLLDEAIDMLWDEAAPPPSANCGVVTPATQAREAQCRALLAQAAQRPGSVPRIRINQCQGWLAEERLCQRLRARGHQIRGQVTLRGGSGGSRADVAPAHPGARGITNLLESKHLDLDRYRQPGGALDSTRLTRAILSHMAQVQRHQRAAQAHGDVPTRESIVYQLSHARPGEHATFLQLFRQLAQPRGMRGGVLRMV